MGKVQTEIDIPQVINYVATTINVGSTATLASNQNATVTNVGTEFNAILNFGIPRGKSAYEQAVAGGYQGTEQEFNAALASDITTVANNISDINTVGADITNVNTVAGNTTNIDKVAAIDSDVTTVAGISSDVTNVASIKNAVVAVNANESKINIVYDNLANVNTVASNITNVNTVSGISSDVTTVAGISTAVSTVSTNVASVSSVATNISNVNAVAANESNINAVNSNKTNIDSVAAVDLDITTVAASISDVTAVSTDIANISAVADDLTNIDLVAGSLPAIQDKQNKTLDTPITVDGVTQTTVEAALGAINTFSAGKQDALVSGTNIKTVNNNSLLGSGNINIDSLPSQTGNNGKFLTTDGSSASWADVDALPSQTGQSGKYLTTDGSAASWASIPATLSADGATIENNSNVLTTIGVKDQNSGNAIKKWYGTKAQLDAITTKDSNTEYATTDEYEGQSIVIDNALSSSSENAVQNKVIKAALDAKQAAITGAASSITSSNLTASKALASDASGKVVASSVTATELGYVSGVTSAIQTQLNAKQTTANLVTSVSSASTDSQYPSAKLFYDTCGDIETLINAL